MRRSNTFTLTRCASDWLATPEIGDGRASTSTRACALRNNLSAALCPSTAGEFPPIRAPGFDPQAPLHL